MKRVSYITQLTLTLILVVYTQLIYAQNGNTSWSAAFEKQKVFIENKGQFHIHNSTEPVLYAYDNGSTMIYFTSKGVTYSFLKRWKKEENENERELEQEEIKKGKTHAEIEAEEHKMEFKTDVVKFVWENANTTVEIIPEGETNDYQSYNVKEKDGSEKNINYIKAYKKIIYKNIYPNIDVEYVFHPTDGIKYSLIVHSGADISKVKMVYSDNIKLKNNDLHLPTVFGDIVEHAPVTFYSDNKSEIISSRFVKTGKSISFELGAYNHSKTIIVDPWVQTPTISNSNSVWECERDGAGNVYIIGGDMPMKLIKYNSAGAFQWTYNTTWDTANYWLGTFAVDLAGNSYVTSGTQSKISKVNTTGGNVWTNNSIGGSSAELWNITFNCDQTKLIIGGTSGILTLRGAIFDLDVTNGSVITTKVVGYDKPLLLGALAPDEVRSICSAKNGNYYFLILDSIGRISQNFNGCSSNPSLFKISSTYDFAYYNPSYRYDNSGIMAIKANQNFVYTQNGTTIHKRSLSSLAILSSVTIPGGINVAGVFGNPGQVPGSSGIDIDTCGNIYVGSSSGVYKFDANLNQIGFAALPFTVFDVTVSTSGNIIAAGSTTQTSGVRTGYVQSIASFAACNPLTITCCNASICPEAPLCSTGPSVTLTAATAGGTWSGPGVNSSTGVFNPVTTGVGTFTVYYSLACGMDSINITVNACATLTACQETNGNITVSGGTPNYTWQSQSTTLDCSGCPLGQCLPPICNGVTVITWTTFATGVTATPPGTYPIHVTDASSNVLQINSLASLPACSGCPAFSATSASIVNVNCFGQSTGSFSVSTTGGASPYDYVLMNGATTVATFTNVAGSQAFSSLPAGTYTLNVLDNSGCPGSTTITITQPASPLTVAISGSSPATCGSSNGSATALGSGGTGTITYSWSPSGGSAATASGLAAGPYTVTATDTKGCTSSTPVTITSSGGATIAITSQTNVLCFGASTGSATATASSGTSPYDYVWTGTAGTLQTTNNITGPNTMSALAAGTYTVTVTDNNSCVSSFTVVITQPSSAVSVAITASTNATCGSANGSATALASNGTSGYTYSWTPSGGSAATANNLSANTYTVTATDGNGCTATTTAVIGSSGGPTVSLVTQINILCNGASTGSATVSATGGTGTLTYSWSGGGGNSTTASALSAGTYIVTVTDSSNCSNTLSVTITQPNAITASVTTTPSNCGSSDGSATVTATGGTGSLTYLWSAPGGSSATLNNISNGSYTVTVTDANSCVQTATGVVGSIGGPTANAGSNATIVAGTGTILNGTGTTGASYNWGPSSTLTNATTLTPTASPLQTTTYTLTVTQNGCSATDSVTVFVEMPCGEIFVPSAFSPNGGDATENEVLKVYGNCILNLEFAIFDRWGEKVFETTNPAIGWDGTYKGKKLDTAVFVYFLKATVDGIDVKKQGNITLVK
ncbi:MAG: hypothetical protein A3F72_19015 [Bacteroidetes bacterium RIFCSPLOWO2_12_FULL_35_15]|nr:MAG: hypothetical protein A3F72_19015 [Bacteroidetes bacterium RIFCSPLOWO2_12_FULL_35_15]